MDIEKIKQFVSPWASSLHFRIKIYFFGSRFKGEHKPDSDYDLAIQFLDNFHHTLTWMDYHDKWQNELSKITGLKIHLLLYDNININTKKYVKEKSVIIYESPPLHETYDEDFERDLAFLSNNE
jgi:predicted nucleotidyltransferase